MLRALLAIAIVLVSTGAHAWPADVYADLRAGEERFEKLAAVEWVEVEDPTVLDAEVLPSGELLLTGKAKGRTLLLLYAEGKFAVWRVRVGTPPVEVGPDGEPLQKAKKLCGAGFKVNAARGGGEAELVTAVPNDACRLALRALFETDAFRARDLELVFDVPAFQAQLADVAEGIRAAGVKGVTARYHGAGLVLEGKVTAAEKRKVLWAVFKRSVGRVPLGDKLEVTDQQQDVKEEK